MRILHISKAAPLGDKSVESVRSHIEQAIDTSDEATLEDVYKVYEIAARKLADALYTSLPQGTLYRLVTNLMGIYAKKCGYKGVMEDQK